MARSARRPARMRMDLDDGKALLRDLEQSGLSQRAFADLLGISVGTIQYWRRRVRQASDFVAVRVVEEGAHDAGASFAWAFELELGPDRVLRFRSGLAQEELEQVLRAASATC